MDFLRVLNVFKGKTDKMEKNAVALVTASPIKKKQLSSGSVSNIEQSRRLPLWDYFTVPFRRRSKKLCGRWVSTKFKGDVRGISKYVLFMRYYELLNLNANNDAV